MPILLFATLLVLIRYVEGAMQFALDDLFPKGTAVGVGASVDAGLLTGITITPWRAQIPAPEAKYWRTA